MRTTPPGGPRDEARRLCRTGENGGPIAPIPPAHPTPVQLDELVQRLTGILTTAIKAVGRLASQTGHSAP